MRVLPALLKCCESVPYPALSSEVAALQLHIMAGDIITLQIGSYANYVGAHFWNLQDEAISNIQAQGSSSSVAASINHEVLCSWSENQDGYATYRPRAVVLDLCGSLGGVSFSSDAGAAAAVGGSLSWSGAVQIHNLGNVHKNQYRKHLEAAGKADTDDAQVLAAQQQALEAAAQSLQQAGQQPKFWTDYLQVDMHPSTALVLPGVWQGVAQWDGWGPAAPPGAAREAAEAVQEKVRWWAEQCDRMQGFQIFADDTGGWGGITLDLLQALRDTYAWQPLMYFSVQQQQQATSSSPARTARRTRHVLSSSISIAEVTQYSSLYVPMAAPSKWLGATGGSSSLYYTSGLLAAGIDSATLALRPSGAVSCCAKCSAAPP
eukprot:GHRR01014621.1.p1 GENE.GHRR01014621.1~~GHRR01014621.1.p1  ORF type:complete len:376 (+),score=113.27 GHRR01014621.1:168-1295(+)